MAHCQIHVATKEDLCIRSFKHPGRFCKLAEASGFHGRAAAAHGCAADSLFLAAKHTHAPGRGHARFRVNLIDHGGHHARPCQGWACPCKHNIIRKKEEKRKRKEKNDWNLEALWCVSLLDRFNMPRGPDSGCHLSETRLDHVNWPISAICDASPQKLCFLQIIRKVVVFWSPSPNCRSFIQLTLVSTCNSWCRLNLFIYYFSRSHD